MYTKSKSRDFYMALPSDTTQDLQSHVKYSWVISSTASSCDSFNNLNGNK